MVTGQSPNFSVSNLPPPVATTQPATNVTATTATLNGIVDPNGSSTTVTFEYGTTTAYGSTATATQSPLSGSGNINVSADITGLSANSTMHFRVKAENTNGTAMGSDLNFVVQQALTVTDYDGNVYQTVQIGTQIWLKENLKTTHYRDGTAIPNVSDQNQWSNLTSGAYCNYNNSTSNSDIYGRLYNWYAVCNSHNLAPEGWHISTDAEWTTLRDFLGGPEVAGGKIKEAGFTHWSSPNTGATNESGFTALGGGYRKYSGEFSGILTYENWYSDGQNGWVVMHIHSALGGGGANGSPNNGCAIRCVKD
jgi:uncharacterized protein (TIGR02145 family)